MSDYKVGDVVDAHTTCPRGCCVRNVYYRVKISEVVGNVGAWCEYNKDNRIFFRFEEIEPSA